MTYVYLNVKSYNVIKVQQKHGAQKKANTQQCCSLHEYTWLLLNRQHACMQVRQDFQMGRGPAWAASMLAYISMSGVTRVCPHDGQCINQSAGICRIRARIDESGSSMGPAGQSFSTHV
jgi:hypothetical protein